MTEYDLTTEEQILHLMVKDRKAVSDFANSHLKADHFHSSNRTILEAALYAEACNVRLTRKSLEMYCERIGLDKMDTLAEYGRWNRISTVIGVTIDDMPMLLEKLRTAYLDRMSFQYIEQFKANRASEKGIEFAAKELREQLAGCLDNVEERSPIVHVNVESDEFFNEWKADVKNRETAEKPLIECGLPEFDEVMGTGFSAETLVVVVADVGSYKSTTMLNIAENVAEINEVDVLFVPLEMPRLQIMNKIMSRSCQIPFEKIQKPRNVLTAEEWAKFDDVHERRKERKGRMALLEFGERTTVGAIRRQIEKHFSHHQPRLVVIDYIANLHAERSHYGRNDLEIGDMLKDLLKMGKPGSVTPLGFSVLTGAQLGRTAITRLRNQKDQTKQSLGSEDIQGSHQYSADATSIFGLVKDPNEPNAKVHVFPIKNRFGKTTYANNSIKATLRVRPEISMLFSEKDKGWKSAADDDILMKATTSFPNVHMSGDEEMYDSASLESEADALLR